MHIKDRYWAVKRQQRIALLVGPSRQVERLGNSHAKSAPAVPLLQDPQWFGEKVDGVRKHIVVFGVVKGSKTKKGL